jgi:hypothetical protein
LSITLDRIQALRCGAVRPPRVEGRGIGHIISAVTCPSLRTKQCFCAERQSMRCACAARLPCEREKGQAGTHNRARKAERAAPNHLSGHSSRWMWSGTTLSRHTGTVDGGTQTGHMLPCCSVRAGKRSSAKSNVFCSVPAGIAACERRPAGRRRRSDGDPITERQAAGHIVMIKGRVTRVPGLLDRTRKRVKPSDRGTRPCLASAGGSVSRGHSSHPHERPFAAVVLSRSLAAASRGTRMQCS